MKKIPRKFCIMPFVSGMVDTDGQIKVCCKQECSKSKFKDANFNIKVNSLAEWRDSKYRKYLQKKFLKGHQPEECQTCYKEEKINGSSLRTRKNYYYKLDKLKNLEMLEKHVSKNTSPIEWELAISNLCNLKCMMCRGKESSKLLVENKKIFSQKKTSFKNEGVAYNLSQKNFNTGKNFHKNIELLYEDQIHLLNLRGGEPFIIPEVEDVLKTLVKKNKTKNTTIQLVTNGTIYKDSFAKLLNKFKTTHIVFSIDSYGIHNDYLRFPSNWKKIVKNINSCQKHINNLSIYVNTTVTNLGLLNLDKLINFCLKRNFYQKLDFLINPDYMKIDVLPNSVRKQVLKKLGKIKNKSKTENLQFLLEKISKENDASTIERGTKRLKEIVSLRDRFRKISIFDYMKNAKEIL